MDIGFNSLVPGINLSAPSYIIEVNDGSGWKDFSDEETMDYAEDKLMELQSDTNARYRVTTRYYVL